MNPPIPAADLPPLAGRAFSHGAPLAALLLASLGAGCGGPPDETGPAAAEIAGPAGGSHPVGDAEPSGTERADLQALVESFTPIDPASTSDRHDAWLARQRAQLARLCAHAGPALGGLALEAFDADPERPDEVRVALLEVAAHGLGAELAPRLEALITTYGADSGLRVRTEAVRILAATSPERALAFLGPLAREDRPSHTRPAQAALLDGWIAAARAVEGADTRVLADVATNIFQPPEARYAAIDGLGEFGGPLAGKALEEVLVESSSDGYVRRKAAQALARCVPAEALCATLERVAGHESDPFFLDFLADMLDRHCRGVAAAAQASPGADGQQREQEQR